MTREDRDLIVRMRDTLDAWAKDHRAAMAVGTDCVAGTCDPNEECPCLYCRSDRLIGEATPPPDVTEPG